MPANLGTAYVQIVPSAQGITGQMEQIVDPASASAGVKGGETLGSKLVSSMSKIMVGLGIGKVIGDTFLQGGALEQSLGGVETIFQGSADKVKDYASRAFNDVGVSANQYMEQVTGFSASLLQSLEGDTEKAADYAHMAMIDMADNANKFGTDMSSIQYAYQGFAKQNYTMLDNLKLGYGGTKQEMERLIQDANKLKEANGEMGDLSIEKFGDVVEAVHLIQDEMDITGTTADEASKTLVGSFNAMKSAAKDLLGNLALGEDIMPSFENLLETTQTFAMNNFLPMLATVIKSVFEIVMNLPDLILSGMRMVENVSNGFEENIPLFLSKVAEMLKALAFKILENMPEIIQLGIEIVKNIAIGIYKSIPDIWNAALEIAKQIPDAFIKSLTEINVALQKIMDNVEEKLKQLPGKVWELIKSIPQKLADAFDFEIPKIKLPHISVKGQLSLVPPSVPSIGIDWYDKAMDKGMIMNGPTIFGYDHSTGSLLGGGETGSETIVGTSSLMSMIGSAVREDSINNSNNMNNVIRLLNTIADGVQNGSQIVLDSGLLVGALANKTDFELGNIQNSKLRGVY